MSASLDTSAAAVQAATASLEIGTQASWFWNAMPQPASSYDVSTGTRLTFKFSDSHNLWLMGSQAEYDACDFTGATELASTTHGGAVGQDKADGLSNLYEATVAREGTLRFACQVGSHCDEGQKVVVHVTPAPPLAPLPPSPPPVSGSGSGSGGGSCDACCPVGTCDSNGDASKPECADCATCQNGGGSCPKNEDSAAASLGTSALGTTLLVTASTALVLRK